ncbi:MAG: integrase core domain-containing protein [Chloroflexota bacterium]
MIIELGSRRVVHLGVTRFPTDVWVAQQWREATPFGQGPMHLIRDNDQKYGQHFAAVAAGAGIDVIKTPIRAPRANAICERFIGSVRRECLNHFLIRDEYQLFRILKAYTEYFNACRPHQGLAQRLPQPPHEVSVPTLSGPVLARPLLGGLHHHYYRLVNARHIKNVPGRKPDYQDCQWIQKLHGLGLLSASFRPDAEMCVLRAYVRHRAELTRHRAPHILHIQQALQQMNLQLSQALTDITGVTGMAILRAISLENAMR